MNDDIHDYSDIISLAHPISTKHPPMSRINRAAQFAPFAALTGHKEAISETQRITDARKTLDEHKKIIINEALQNIVQVVQKHPWIEITYFQEDNKKEGGSYITLKKRVKQIDEFHRKLIFVDRTMIAFDDIYNLSIIDN